VNTPDRETMPPAPAPEVSERAAALPQEALPIASGHAFSGPALHLGALLWDGQCLPDARVRVPPTMLSGHGLVAVATGTGRPKKSFRTAEAEVRLRRAVGQPRSSLLPFGGCGGFRVSGWEWGLGVLRAASARRRARRIAYGS
jgi:hypothetical protein